MSITSRCCLADIFTKKEKQPAQSRFVGHRCRHDVQSDSDHTPILFTFKQAGPSGKDMTLLSWNILCQYGYNEEYGFPFDGFCRRSESNLDYVKRLHRAAEEVKVHAVELDPDAILLQECAHSSEYGYGFILGSLSELLSPLGYTLLHDGEFITAVKAKSAVQLQLPVLERQDGKMHVLFSEELGCIIVNVHLQYDKDGSDDELKSRAAIEQAIAAMTEMHPGAKIFIVGDTNRVPTHVPRVDKEAATIEQLVDGLGLLCYPPGPTNVRWNGGAKAPEMTYADFALLVS